MASKKISALTSATTLGGAEVVPVVQSGTTKKATVAQISAYGQNLLLDPTAATVLRDEFMFGSTESGEMGELGWGFTNGTFNLANSEANHPGVATRASTAVSGTIASTYVGGGGSSIDIMAGQVDEMIWIVEPQTAGADFDIRFGLSADWSSLTPTSGVYFERLAADTNWFAVTRTSSTQTRTSLAIALTAAWFKLRMRRIGTNDWRFSVDGGTEVILTANCPPDTIQLSPGNHINPTSANARSFNVDFFGMRLLAQAR